MHKNKTYSVKAGRVQIGGGSPLSVQTMWKRSLHDLTERDLDEIRYLEEAGCDLLRFAVPDMKSAAVLSEIRPEFRMPFVADIHFDYKLALECIGAGIDKIRINPGNIGAEWKVREVLSAAADKNVPIRIGVNSGSLPVDLRGRKDVASAMVEAAEREIDILERTGFLNAVFSLKASSVEETINANREFGKKYHYPLHIGVTEAGPDIPGIVKSSIAFYQLLGEGLGDTIRVSLTDEPVKEVITGREILRTMGLGGEGAEIISCPRCGRHTFDTHGFLEKVKPELYKIRKPVKIAVMGCVVNGPEEAKGADIGITGVGNRIVIFKHGKVIRKVDENKSMEAFMAEIKKFLEE